MPDATQNTSLTALALAIERHRLLADSAMDSAFVELRAVRAGLIALGLSTPSSAAIARLITAMQLRDQIDQRFAHIVAGTAIVTEHANSPSAALRVVCAQMTRIGEAVDNTVADAMSAIDLIEHLARARPGTENLLQHAAALRTALSNLQRIGLEMTRLGAEGAGKGTGRDCDDDVAMDALWQLYTMEDERTVHRAAIG